MAAEHDFQRVLNALRLVGDRLLILVEDSDADTGWRLLTDADLTDIARSLESSAPEESVPPSRLCYNVAEASRMLGVSVHKFNDWLRRPQHAVPHIKDGRRIVIPIHLLVQWLSEEAARNLDTGAQAQRQ